MRAWCVCLCDVCMDVYNMYIICIYIYIYICIHIIYIIYIYIYNVNTLTYSCVRSRALNTHVHSTTERERESQINRQREREGGDKHRQNKKRQTGSACGYTRYHMSDTIYHMPVRRQETCNTCICNTL